MNGIMISVLDDEIARLQRKRDDALREAAQELISDMREQVRREREIAAGGSDARNGR